MKENSIQEFNYIKPFQMVVNFPTGRQVGHPAFAGHLKFKPFKPETQNAKLRFQHHSLILTSIHFYYDWFFETDMPDIFRFVNSRLGI